MGNLGKMAIGQQTEKFNGQQNVDEANKLLAQNVDEDYNILKQLGLNDHDLDAKLESFGEYTRITKYSEQWGYCVSKEVLENIAYKHDLTLGESKYYKFSVPVTITADIKTWCEKTGVSMDESYSFYILAPSESFYDEEEYAENGNKKKCEKTGGDPMLVYEIAGSDASGGSVYSLVTEWGKDLNPLRKIKAFFVNRAKTFTILGVLATMFAVTTIVYQAINTLTVGFAGNDWVTIIMGLMALIGTVVVLFPIYEDIDATNIKRKHFNITRLARNFNTFIIGSYYDNYEEYRFSRIFADMVGRFLIVGAIFSLFFFIFFVASDDATSFAQDLGYSNWYFTIPMGAVIVSFITALVVDVFRNINW